MTKHGITWSPENEAPSTTIIAQLAKYQTDKKNAEDNALKAKQDADTSLVKVTQTEDTGEAAKTAALKNQKAAEAATLAAKAEKSNEFTIATETIATLRKE